MICPSDHLEVVIRNNFKGRKYFYSSLGNTLILDDNTLKDIAELVKKHEISEITFILSESNSIVKDALMNQKFIKIYGLYDTYRHLMLHKKHLINTWGIYNQRKIILSYHLNEKIKELKSQLPLYLTNTPNINGELFSRSSNSFTPIYPELVCNDCISLN